jgi:CRP/FNR family transcriptional regulator, cyclic AMP receptor protein
MERRAPPQPLPLATATEAPDWFTASAAPKHPPLPPGEAFAETRRYERGRTVVAQGSCAGELFVVRDGLLREAAVSADGRWFVHALLGPGDVFGTTASSTVAAATVRTLRPSTLRVLSPQHLDQAVRRRPDVGRWLMDRLERRAIRAQRTVHDLAWSDAGVRLRRRLVALARDYGRRTSVGILIDIPITQEDLGAMIGATRETVNRSLVGLIASGLLRVEHRRYVLLQPLIESMPDDGEA